MKPMCWRLNAATGFFNCRYQQIQSFLIGLQIRSKTAFVADTAHRQFVRELDLHGRARVRSLAGMLASDTHSSMPWMSEPLGP